MEDPVIIESGRTFDRSSINALFESLKSAGQPCFCPVTMVQVDPEIMIDNKNLKNEIERYYEENPWAFEYDPRMHYKNIDIGAEMFETLR